MELHNAKNLAETLIAQWPELCGWVVAISKRSRRVLGCCQYRFRTIKLSASFIQLNDEQTVRDVILHEIAHALCPGHGHNRVWKQMAAMIGASPTRCNTTATMPEGRYVAHCPSCRRRFNRYRRPKNNIFRWCKRCGPLRGILNYQLNGTH